MLPIKIKKMENRMQTLYESQCFHLDSEQQEKALYAKKQLQACSQQCSDIVLGESYKPARQNCQWGKENPISIRTSTTDRQSRSYCSKNQLRISLKKEKSLRKENTLPHQYQQVKNINEKYCLMDKKQSSRVSDLSTDKNSINTSKQNNIPKFKTQIQFYSQRKIKAPQSSRGFIGNKFTDNLLKKKLMQTAKTSRISARKFSYFGSEQTNEKNDKCRFYTFNDAMSNGKEDCSLKTYRNKPAAKNELNEEQTSRPSSFRQMKVKLRPQFLRLIKKIKQKQDEANARNLVVIKGRRKPQLQ